MKVYISATEIRDLLKLPENAEIVIDNDSHQAPQQKKNKITKTSNSFKPWTDHEDQIIRDNYAMIGAKRIARQIGRTHGSVQARASALGVRRFKLVLSTNDHA